MQNIINTRNWFNKRHYDYLRHTKFHKRYNIFQSMSLHNHFFHKSAHYWETIEMNRTINNLQMAAQLMILCRVTRLGNSSPIRQLFCRLIEAISPQNVNILGSNLLHFHRNKMFKSKFYILNYLAWLLFWLLFKILGEFFPNHLVTLILCHLIKSNSN